ncbi:elongation of very long chain fatty acids protein 7-like isoform X1 [Cydia pomonella]|uniref:elongation of very long chain fatty acids protein 7-like isoform X1 n=1 Tax=Cydia pomonella TaxID=82600 RepID=UPI002ADDB797|nr:elongation of very long chain fatty acids protein 7-like isoform X1 [Cydia pomonella]
MLRIRTSSVVQYYKYVFGELADPRTNNWFLISSPIPGLIIIYLYLQFVTKWGPRYMANKPPFQLQKTLVVYNFLQVCVSCWIVYEGLDAAWLRHYSLKCQPVDFSNSHEGMRAARCVYIYFLAKITELLDTVFFVLRKKDRQITFLHLYHHAAMPMISWGATKYYPGGHGTFIGLVNSFVHIFMYAYYMVAALGPEYQRKLNWWKRQITTLQMVSCLSYSCNDGYVFERTRLIKVKFDFSRNMPFCTGSCNIHFMTVFLYFVGGKQANGPPDSKQFPQSLDACNSRGVTCASTTLRTLVELHIITTSTHT